MTARPPRLPPLNALRVFHSVARHRSFRRAADELSVTPQAVSQQVRLLEETLGVALFDRRGRSIEPTEQALLLARYVEAGFEEFAEGVRRVTQLRRRDRINLNVSPYFATHYLLGRLARFRARAPEVDLRLTTRVEMPDFAGQDVDASVQWGYGAWKGLEQTLLVRDPKIICCTPAIAAGIAGPADLPAHTLLEPVPNGDFWSGILRHFGLPSPEAPSRVELQDAATMRRAAVSGLGIGLLSASDAEEELRAGRLVAPLGRDALGGMPVDRVPGFYLVLPRAHRRAPMVAAFCDWITGENWKADLPETGQDPVA